MQDNSFSGLPLVKMVIPLFLLLNAAGLSFAFWYMEYGPIADPSAEPSYIMGVPALIAWISLFEFFFVPRLFRNNPKANTIIFALIVSWIMIPILLFVLFATTLT